MVMAQKNHFPSDIATILLAAGLFVDIQTGCRRLKLTLEEFLEMSPCDSETIVLSVAIPTFLAQISTSKTSDGVVLESHQLDFVAYGTKHAIRVRFWNLDSFFSILPAVVILSSPTPTVSDSLDAQSIHSVYYTVLHFDFIISREPIAAPCS
ncbi:hypothetical protein NE237_023041 [Protea cynaroides]|uniref:Uncharacterized protein n=1 Tax=Protea cynaroides TaxID=273540 RepID=A0A9Q0HFK7_9MAGN|nr:hypothetical protein NE237_023041 [Protea cynaroides]